MLDWILRSHKTYYLLPMFSRKHTSNNFRNTERFYYKIGNNYQTIAKTISCVLLEIRKMIKRDFHFKSIKKYNLS